MVVFVFSRLASNGRDAVNTMICGFCNVLTDSGYAASII